MWQVFIKKRGNWETHGDPTTREEAEMVVAALRKKLKDGEKGFSEPHCVPV